MEEFFETLKVTIRLQNRVWEDYDRARENKRFLPDQDSRTCWLPHT